MVLNFNFNFSSCWKLDGKRGGMREILVTPVKNLHLIPTCRAEDKH